MKLYLYLNKETHVETWINGGGPVTLSLASNYWNKDRNGIYTPDENLQIESKGDPLCIPGVFEFGNNVTIHAENNKIFYKGMINHNIYHYQKFEDALIICFSTNFHQKAALKFKKMFCVEIIDYVKLFNSLNDQIGLIGKDGFCHYTKGLNRNHFLKSIEDKWQKEYRIIWVGLSEKVDVFIPKGIAIDRTRDLNIKTSLY